MQRSLHRVINDSRLWSRRCHRASRRWQNSRHLSRSVWRASHLSLCDFLPNCHLVLVICRVSRRLLGHCDYLSGFLRRRFGLRWWRRRLCHRGFWWRRFWRRGCCYRTRDHFFLLYRTNSSLGYQSLNVRSINDKVTNRVILNLIHNLCYTHQ